MATLRKDGRWMASLGTGKTRRAFYGATEEEAERKKRAACPSPTPHFEDGTLDAFVAKVWWPQVMATTKLPTQRRYKAMYDRHIGPHLGDRRLQDLRLEVLQSWANVIATEPRPKTKFGPKNGEYLAPKTVWLIRGVMGTILSLAERTGRIERNECKWVKIKAKPRKKARRDLTIEMVRAVVEAAKGTSFEGPVWAASTLGLRRGELMGLRLTDIEDDRVVLRRTRDKSYEGPLKMRGDGEECPLPIPYSVAQRLRSYAEPGAIYVFGHKGHPMRPDTLTKAMPGLCQEAGVQTITVHDLRGACASNLRSLGVNVGTIMEILRHSTLRETEIYLDRRDDEMSEAIGRLADAT